MEIQSLFKISYESFIETIYRGDQLAFKYNDKYYFIEGNSFDNEEKGRVGSYYIVDPGIDEYGNKYSDPIEHPLCDKVKTADELMEIPFLDGKTLKEAFPDMWFID